MPAIIADYYGDGFRREAVLRDATLSFADVREDICIRHFFEAEYMAIATLMSYVDIMASTPEMMYYMKIFSRRL